MDVRRGRKTERLPLEAKIESETVEQEDKTVSEIVEQKLKPWYGVDETKRETIEQKLKQVGKGKKLNLKRKGISCNREKIQVWQKELAEKFYRLVTASLKVL